MSGPADDVEAARRAGRQRFLGIDLLVGPGVLVPRPETELLARTAIEELRAVASQRPIRVLDVGTGSGNLACAIAVHVPAATVLACDISLAAVTLARRNALQAGVGARVEVVQGDLFAPLDPDHTENLLDAIVCNPPYISTRRLQTDRAELLRHEPLEAFDGGPYGLSVHQRLAREAATHLRPGGLLLVEVGAGQDRQVMLLLERAGHWEAPEVRHDGGGVPRVVLVRRKAGRIRGPEDARA